MFQFSVLLSLVFSNIVNSGEIHTDDVISEQRRVELKNLLLQDCGSCHGITMKGGLGPALTKEALKDKPRIKIENSILYGRPGTPMPPWKTLLTEQEVRWIVDVLYAGVK